MASKKSRAARRSATTQRAGAAIARNTGTAHPGMDVARPPVSRPVTGAALPLAQPFTFTWSRIQTITVALLVVAALGLYFFRLGEPNRYVYDEVYHAYTAMQLAAGNADAYVWYTKVPEQDKGVAYEWTHPAFAKLPMEAGVLLFGANSFGWRFASAIFGALGIGAFYVLGYVLFDRTIALLATGMLLFDGLWFVQSRTAMNDIFVVFFLLLGYIAFRFYLGYDDRRRWLPLWLSGVALGFAIGSKWSGFYSLGFMGLIATVREARRYLKHRGEGWLRPLLTLAGAFVAVPFAIYLGVYIQFFWMGHTLAQWVELQRQMWYYHTSLKATHAWASSPWTWPLMIKPVWYYVNYLGDNIQNVFAMGNPLIWWAFLPAIVFVGSRWRDGKFRSISLGLVLLGFLGQWLPWFASPRIAFLYHFLPSLPFGVLAVAYALAQLLRNQRLLVVGYLAAVVIVFVYFYPQYSALTVSRDFAEQHYWLSSWQPR